MKFGIVTQQVKVLSEQSLASSSVVKSAGKPGDPPEAESRTDQGRRVCIEPRKMYSCGPKG